jgi:hypothetical protein
LIEMRPSWEDVARRYPAAKESSAAKPEATESCLDRTLSTRSTPSTRSRNMTPAS